jgi:Ca-activated chloride channel family protein
MRTLAALFGSMIICLAGSAMAQGPTVGGSPLQTRIRMDANGDIYVGIWIDAPDAVRPTTRAPMAVSLVVDTSGSMAGEKIENARLAASSLLESMVDGDVVSIYAFNQSVTEIAPPTVMSAATRSGLMQRVSLLVAMGGTNMYDGMRTGVARIAQAPATHPLRRIFLISDGIANIGPSDPVSLGDLAARATEFGTQVTAIGVGFDYDQTTLSAMAIRSSGRLYHLAQPSQMASILEQEMSLLSRSVALNAYIDVAPAPGVQIVEGLTSGATVENGHLRFPLGAVHAGQHREVLFRARLDTRTAGDRQLATARLVYQTTSQEQQTQSAQLAYEVTRDAAAAPASVVPRVAALVADHEATLAQRRAAELLRQGQNTQAATLLAGAQQQLEEQAARAPAAPSSARLRERARSLERGGRAAGAATSAPAQIEQSYDMADEAAGAEGY